MAITTKTSRTIRGISYTQGKSFVCAADGIKGNGGSEGNAGSAAALTKGKTYYFLGYAVASDSGSTVKYPCRIGSSSSTSSAIGWYPESVFPYATYKIVCNANGGSGGKTITKTYGTAITLPSGLTRSGYTFMGWGTSATDTSVDYAGGAKYTANAAKTLYAIWKKTIKITYNNNGGTGGPGSQSADVYNSTTSKTFTLPTTTPTKSGYAFLGWSTSSSATSASYSAGGSITLSSSDTLYAIWRKTIKVTYNAKGGTDAPSEQSVNVYNSTTSYKFTLSSTIPKKTNYNFLGWSTNSNAQTVSYAAGSSQTFSSNTTLYAVWELAYVKPRITDLTVQRYSITDESSGNWIIDEMGTYGLVSFNYSCDMEMIETDAIVISWKSASMAEEKNMTFSPTPNMTDGSISEYIGEGELSTDEEYTITVTVTDQNGYSEKYIVLPGTKFAIDVMSECAGISFGGPAERAGMADFRGYVIRPTKGYANIPMSENADFNDYKTPNTYISYDKVATTYLNCPITSGTFTLEVTSAGTEGQIRQRVQYCSKTGSVIYERYYYGSNEDDTLNWSPWYEAGGLKSAITVGLTAGWSPSTINTYEQVKMNDTKISLGYGLSLDENNYIVIGKGVRHVRVSGQTRIVCGATDGNRHARLRKDSQGSISDFAWANIRMSASWQMPITFTPVIINVSEGDKLYMVFYTPDITDSCSSGTRSNGWATYMTVESL